MKLVAVILVLSVVASGCTSTSSTKPAATTSPPAEVDVGQGTECLQGVVISDENFPLDSANVRLVEPNVSVTTGIDGAFEFCGLQPGRYTIEAHRLGYTSHKAAVDLPAPPARMRIVLKPIPIKESHFLTVPKSVYYNFGLSTLDTTTSRYGVNLTTCGPCTWTIQAAGVPSFLLWEATWVRNPAPPSGITDMMYHILRGGAPFESATDIGFGSFPKPFRVEYNKEKLLTNANVKAAATKGGDIPLSGSMYCWGSQAWPCLDQRIHMYLSFLYDYDAVPENFTALPPG